MLFDDFFLLTRLKRPVITKMFQIFHRTTFRSSRSLSKQSPIDWFDAPESAHLGLIVYKKVIHLQKQKTLAVSLMFCLRSR